MNWPSQSQRYRLRYDGMIHILEIPKVRDYDSGNLRIVAKNPVGAVECTSSLSVMPRDDWRSRLKQAPRCECPFFLHFWHIQRKGAFIGPCFEIQEITY